MEFINFFILYMVIFSRCPWICGSISKTTNIFWNILETSNFCWFVHLQSYDNKSTFSFLQTVKLEHITFVNKPFLCKMLVSFFSFNIPLYVEKNLVEKLCEALEIELKTYTLVNPSSFSRKSISKFCIIFNMISFTNVQALAKIRLTC